MKTRIHSIRLIFLLMLTLGYTQANSQEYYQENPKAISLFNRLNKMFPRRYLTHTNLQYAFYHLEYYFKDSKDYEKYQAPINDIIKEMKEMKRYKRKEQLEMERSKLEEKSEKVINKQRINTPQIEEHIGMKMKEMMKK